MEKDMDTIQFEHRYEVQDLIKGQRNVKTLL